jgi:hypothetical protein
LSRDLGTFLTRDLGAFLSRDLGTFLAGDLGTFLARDLRTFLTGNLDIRSAVTSTQDRSCSLVKFHARKISEFRSRRCIIHWLLKFTKTHIVKIRFQKVGPR